MERMMTLWGALTAGSIPVTAAGGTEATGTSLLTILLLGFGALIVVGRLIPGLVIFGGIVKGLFGKRGAKPLHPFYPTCSNYAVTAIRRHGALKGLLFSTRRILGYFG